ncbi:hypothetical protein [Streptomyces griseosporeus]|uniref:hypothetical protein n=1 Tax=Streptomyces griseosporeus TaxID=1910 RepID=UPI0037027523
MTEIPTTESAFVSPEEEAAFERVQADAVATGRAMSSGEYLAGILAAAQLDTAGTPRKLPADLWPEVDPVVVQEIWDRACVVAWRAAQFASSAWLHRDRLEAVRGQLAEAGYEAMARSVQRSLRVVVPGSGVHPADGESGRGH